MSEEQKVMTPFEVGVCAALQIIGAAIAGLDVAGRTKVAEAAKSAMAMLPEDESIIKDRSAYHLPLESLISGLLPKQTEKSDG